MSIHWESESNSSSCAALPDSSGVGAILMSDNRLYRFVADNQVRYPFVPFVLFAIRETIQESLGFSPADLVFGHTPRGPLKV